MDLRQLRHFVAVGETLHFGRAAQRLGITQPPLSQSIQRLEQSLGVELLARTRRRVALTAAGRALLTEARDLLARADLAESITRRAASETQELRIGFVPSALYRVLPAALAQFRQRWPGVHVSMTELLSAEQLVRLRNGSLDFGFVFLGQADLQEITVRVVESSSLSVAVPAHSPLAERRTLHMADLAREPFIQADRAANPAIHAIVEAACRQAGFEPNIVQHSNRNFTTLKLVASGIGISLVPAMAEALHVEGVRFVPIADRKLSIRVSVGMAWVERPLSHAARAFVALVEEVSGRPKRSVAGKAKRAD
jgi:DNA-binding transcriptional LysR family regulator